MEEEEPRERMEENEDDGSDGWQLAENMNESDDDQVDDYDAPIELPSDEHVPAVPGRYCIVPPPDLNDVVEDRFLLEYDFPYLIVNELAKNRSWNVEYAAAVGQACAWKDKYSQSVGGFFSGSRCGHSLSDDLHFQLVPNFSYIDERTFVSNEDTFEDLQTKVSKFVAAGTREAVVVDTRGDHVWIHNHGEQPYEVQPLAPVEFDSWPGFTRDARERMGIF